MSCFGSPVKDRCGHTGASPKEVHQGGQEAGALIVPGEVERTESKLNWSQL